MKRQPDPDPFRQFFRRPLFREALWNTLWSGLLVVVFSAVLALPLAYIVARYEFRGKLLLQTAATLPLVIPPFVGAVALQLILGRSGMVNLLLIRWFDSTIPIHGRADRCRAGANSTLFSLYLAQYRRLALQRRSVPGRDGAEHRLPRLSSVSPRDFAADAARFHRRLAC